MEDNKETVIQNNEEGIETKAEEMKPAAESVVDDDIQYTFVVPKGEIYREPEDEDPETVPEPVMVEPEPADEPEDAEKPEDAADTEPAKTIIADRRSFTEELNKAPLVDRPVYAETGLPDDDDITYTFVVPKGEVYQEPDPEEERAAKEAERVRRAVLSAETKVMERESVSDDGGGKKTRYGLPANHPEMGELAKKQEARRRYEQRKKNLFRTRFYVLLSVVFLSIAWFIISNSGLFTIDAIEVKGNSHYTAEEIINIGHATSGRNIIYKANIKETREFLEQNPYIKRAEVRRRLPSTLVINVTERTERMAFKYDDDYLVMDEEGILLKKTRNVPKTTIIQGVVVSKIKLGEKIGAEDSKKLDRALELIGTMIKADMYFVKADISNVKTVKAYIYDTLVVKTDYDTLIANLENGRLHLVVEKLFGDNIERGTISFLDDGSASFSPEF